MGSGVRWRVAGTTQLKDNVVMHLVAHGNYQILLGGVRRLTAGHGTVGRVVMQPNARIIHIT